MGRPKKQREPLPPIWRASDEWWALIEPILAEDDPPKRGPQRIDLEYQERMPTAVAWYS